MCENMNFLVLKRINLKFMIYNIEIIVGLFFKKLWFQINSK